MNNINFGRFLVILVNVMISLSSLGAAGDTYTNPGNQTSGSCHEPPPPCCQSSTLTTPTPPSSASLTSPTSASCPRARRPTPFLWSPPPTSWPGRCLDIYLSIYLSIYIYLSTGIYIFSHRKIQMYLSLLLWRPLILTNSPYTLALYLLARWWSRSLK